MTTAAANTATKKNEVLTVEEGFENPIHLSSWPSSAPHPESKNVISVICGNSRFHWSIHDGSEGDFAPLIFWKSTPIDDEVTQGSNSKKNEPESKSPVWTNFFPGNSFSVMGGQTFESDRTLANLLNHITKKRIPYYHIYVITTNPESSKLLPTLFQSIPCRINQLQASDFFQSDQHNKMYPGIGVDRCAALFGASTFYGKTVLVIDGGTALTWIASNSKGQLMGSGGIALGLGVKFRCMEEYTGSLPFLDLKYIQRRIEECEKQKKPLGMFAGSSTEDAILVGILSEVAGNLVRVIEEWLAEIKKESQEENLKAVEEPKENEGTGNPTGDDPKPMETESAKEADSNNGEDKKNDNPLQVVITGGDGPIISRLLQPQFSHILPPSKWHDDVMEKVKVSHVKNLATHGIAHMLKAKTESLKSVTSAVEKARLMLLGLRVVQIKQTSSSRRRQQIIPKLRGTVIDVKRHDSDILSKDTFKVKWDNGETVILGCMDLFDCLLEYEEEGETATILAQDKTNVAKEERKLKREKSKEVAEHLTTLVPELEVRYKNIKERRLQMQQQPAVVEQEGSDIEQPANPAKRPLENESGGGSQKAQKQSHQGRPSIDELKNIALGISPSAKKPATGSSRTGNALTPQNSTKPAPKPARASDSSKTKAPPAADSSKSQDKKASPSSNIKKGIYAASAIKKEPRKFIGLRVAKMFDKDLYFGRIADFTPPMPTEGEDAALWHVEYDDGDEEDYDVNEMVKYLRLAVVREGDDPQKGRKKN